VKADLYTDACADPVDEQRSRANGANSTREHLVVIRGVLFVDICRPQKMIA
jgi:hypothetical protein